MKNHDQQNRLNLRANWLKSNLPAKIVNLCRRNNINIPVADPTAALSEPDDWGNWQWHVQHRLSSVEELLAIRPEYAGQETALMDWLESYDLSILPLNQFQPDGIKKFLPQPGLILASDPYGVQQEHALVLQEENGKKFYLATRKPQYVTFLPIISGGARRIYCPIGCHGCYRGPQTRFNEPLSLIKKDGSREEIFMLQPLEQIVGLVEQWNNDPQYKEVYDILISGGEPMMLSNAAWKALLIELQKAKYLRSFRICTGALFLGLPFRFDEEFIKLLTDFRDQTGITVKLSVHVSHPDNITPEAILYARRLIEAGIELLPQCPLEAGVNFWLNDLERSEKTLRELDRLLATAVGIRNYKWIIDMQRRRVNEGVSILSAIKVWQHLHDCHQGESDITRPTSLALFFPHERGNLNLSYHSLWAIKMRVERKSGLVHYQIPHPAGGWLDYEEPLWAGVNDSRSILEKMKEK